jgi:extracellular factor (EF) 3-hydroxypalmitic acid methyl ester biosynthesis protein
VQWIRETSEIWVFNLKGSMTTNSPPVKPTRRFRARRIRVGQKNVGSLAASGYHDSLGRFSGAVEDFSFYGLALAIPRTTEPCHVLAGARLKELMVSDAAGPVFRGQGILRRVTERKGALILGIEFEGSGLDMAEVYRRGTRHRFAERWRAHFSSAGHGRISLEFKAWLLDLRIDLEGFRDFLAAETAALDHADQFTRREAESQYLAEIAPQLVARLNRAAAELGDLVRDVPEDLQPAWRALCSNELADLLGHSPFMKRAAAKPLGYAGDYEMMDMLYREHAEGSSLFGKALNMYAAQEAGARAAINRVDLLARLIRDLAAASSGRVRIASVGCGSAREIEVTLLRWPELGPRLDVALIDQEEGSIACCERKLTPLANQTGARVQFIRETIGRLIVAQDLSKALGPRELIYSAGLFDYLHDRSFSALLGALYAALVPGGQLAVGNMSVDNPSRYAMEYFTGWFLLHRTGDQLMSLGRGLAPAPSHLEVGAEPLGINLFLHVRK